MKQKQAWVRAIYLVILAVHLGVIGYFWWRSSGALNGQTTGTTFLALGRLAGLLAATFALQQFVLIGRMPFLEQVLGQDRLSRIHQMTGYLTFTFVILHPILIVNGYASLAKTGYLAQYKELITTFPWVWLAFIAQILFIAIVGASIWIVRRKLRYEWWYSIHLMTYLAISLPFLHQINNGATISSGFFRNYWFALYALVLGSFLLFRFLRPMFNLFYHQFRVISVKPAGGNTTSIEIGGKRMGDFKFKAGQFGIYTFLKRGFWLQEHPFTISKRFDGTSLRITAKDVGDFTHALQGMTVGTRVLVSGPYGVFGRAVEPKQKLLLIAGGVGITPLNVIAQAALEKACDIVLLYANQNHKAVVLKEEIADLAQKGARVVTIMSDDKTYQGEQGRVDIEKIKRLVKDYKKRQIYICGPPPMMFALIDALKKAGVNPNQIFSERFSFHR